MRTGIIIFKKAASIGKKIETAVVGITKIISSTILGILVDTPKTTENAYLNAIVFGEKRILKM